AMPCLAAISFALATADASSMLMEMSSTSYREANSFTVGNALMQGTHQVAQMSIRRYLPHFCDKSILAPATVSSTIGGIAASRVGIRSADSTNVIDEPSSAADSTT